MSLPRRFRRGALWVAGRGLLATTMAGDVGGRSCTDAELLLHPELLSQEFLLLTLEQVGHSGPIKDRRAAGRTGRPAGRLVAAPRPHRSGGACLTRISKGNLERVAGIPEKKKILSSSDRASRTTSAASVQATAYGREGLGEQTYGKSLVQPGLDPEHLRNSLLLSFSPPLETQKLSPREMVLLPRITSWTRSPVGELKAPGFPVVCSPHPSWRDLR